MQVTIHKGSHEIGGNCIQVSSGKTTILLDVGLPLSVDSKPVVDAMLVSHPHWDHFGLMASLPPGTPIYIGKLARSLIDPSRFMQILPGVVSDNDQFSDFIVRGGNPNVEASLTFLRTI